jgi:hypothetical protein
MPNWKKVITSGSDAALNSLLVTNSLTASGLIYPSTDGTTGQVVTTDGAGNLSFSPVENTAIVIKNVSGVTIQKGTPCYITGSGTSGNLAGVFPADAANPLRMPAGVIAGETLTAGAEGIGLINGFIGNVNTSAFGAGNSIYVAAGGGYTNVRPTGSSILVQKLGNVEKSHPSNGSGVINGPGYYNDLPNVQSGYTWVGNSNGVAVAIATSSIQNVVSSSYALSASHASSTAAVAGTTNYVSKFTSGTTIGNSQIFDNGTGVGINNPTPLFKLDISTSSTSDGLRVALGSTSKVVLFADGVVSWGPTADAGVLSWDTGKAIIKGQSGYALSLGANNGADQLYINTSGNIGVGTTNPSYKLTVEDGGQSFNIKPGGSGVDLYSTGNFAPHYQSDFSWYTGAPGSGTFRARLDANGNFGIGTSSPTSITDYKTLTLDSLSGTFTEYRQNTTNHFRIGVDGNRPFLYGNTNQPMDFFTNQILRIRISAGGSLLVGDTVTPSENPWYGTAVFGKNGTDKVITGYLSSSTNGAIIGGHTSALDGWAPLNIDGTELRFNIQQSRKMTLDPSGNLGIGITSPLAKLQISSGDNTDTQLLIGQGSTYGAPSIRFKTATTNYMGLGFITGSAVGNEVLDALVIQRTGNVGIGTTNPGQKLDVAGRALVNEFQYTKAINYNGGDLNSLVTAGFYDGNSMTNAPNGGWFWVTVETYSGDNTWIHQTATSFGASNTTNEIYTRTRTSSTWGAWKKLIDNGDISGTTNYIPKFTGTSTVGNSVIFESGSNIGIGTTSPGSYKLNVNGYIGASRIYPYSTNNTYLSGDGSGLTITGDGYLYVPATGGSYFSNQVRFRNTIENDTNAYLQINGGTSGITYINGSMGISTPTPGALLGFPDALGTKISFNGINSNGYLLALSSSLNGGDALYKFTAGVTSAGEFGFFTTNNCRLFINNAGNVGIGTSSPGYKLDVNGNTNVNGTLTATVKSFIIDHPTKENKKLQYGVLEGPEHSVYVRGKLTNTNVIQLPDYWHALVHEDSITVNLTSIGKPQEIWVEEITDTYITVGSLAENINCFYAVFAERKDIDKLITEFDKE